MRLNEFELWVMEKKIKVSDIQPSPVRHPVLPAALVDRIRAYKQILGDADLTSLDRAIDNFKHDANPERELEIWERIASIYQAFVAAISLQPTPNAAPSSRPC